MCLLEQNTMNGKHGMYNSASVLENTIQYIKRSGNHK